MSLKLERSKREINIINAVIPSKRYAVYCQSKRGEVHCSLWSNSVHAQEKSQDFYTKWLEQTADSISDDELDMVCILPTKANYPSALIALMDNDTCLRHEKILHPVGRYWQQNAISSKAIINKLALLEVSLSDLPCAHRLIVHILKHIWLPFGLVSISSAKMSHNLSMKEEKVERLLLWLYKLNLIEPNWDKCLCVNRRFLKQFTNYPKFKNSIVRHYQQFPLNRQQAKALLKLRKRLLQLSHAYPPAEHEKRIKIVTQFILYHHSILKGPLKRDFERLFLTNYQYEPLNLPLYHLQRSTPNVHSNEAES